mgnify:CR=1 FL=1
MPLNTCVFDAYGTLFDVNAAARTAASEPNREVFKEVWPSVSNIWRMKQLQYTWLRSMTDSYTDFWSITQNSLDFALETHKLQDDLELKERLLALYWELQPYSEVSQILKYLKEKRIKTFNGLEMFIYQGQKSFYLWNKINPEIDDGLIDLLNLKLK